MRKNRRRSKKMSVMAGRSVQIGSVMVMLFVVIIFNMLAESRCKQLMKTIREKESQLVRLEDECTRESTRWAEMQTPERLEAALLRHGLAMRAPAPEQIVRMNADGRPYPGQLSVAKAAQRNKPVVVAVSQRPAVRPAQSRAPAPRKARR